MAQYIGIDYGTKKIGLAISDESGKVAFPHGVFVLKEFEKEINTLIERGTIAGFVIGYSTNQKGEENEIAEIARTLSQTLTATYNLPVHFEKEFFTSTFARQMGQTKEKFNARKTKQKEMGNVDAHAAAIILQRFLDKQK